VFQHFFADFTFYILQHRLVKIKLSNSKKVKKDSFVQAKWAQKKGLQRSTANLGNLIVASLIKTKEFLLKLDLSKPQNVELHSFPQAQWVQETNFLKGSQSIFAFDKF